MTNRFNFSRGMLKAGAALPALALLGAGALSAAPALAQDAGTQVARPENGTQVTPQADTVANGAVRPGAPDATVGSDPSDQNATGGSADIIVTGSLLRRTSTETPSPVTVLTAETLAKAGITNINDAIRSVSADSAGSISTGFTGGFSAGGAAVSLRGLGVSSTLTLIDGLRSANFPLNDDGHNAYVDLNSIPFSIVDRVEVLKDGASSTYGADAIGGVVNIILKKHFTGLAGTVEAGVSQRGDAGRQRGNLTAGYGDYDSQGFNIYLNTEYQNDGSVYDKDRGFPFNSNDLTSIGGLDNNPADNSLTAGSVNAVVRATTQANPNNPLTGGTTATGPYQTLGLANCASGTFTVTGANPGIGCRHDNTYDYTQIQPSQQRYSFNGRLSARIGDNIEAYATGIYSHNEVLTTGIPRSIRSTQPFGASPTLASNNPGIALPVYVCAAGLNCATAADRRFNPYNPFAAQGASARIYYLFGDLPFNTNRNNEVFRGTAGLNGSFGGDKGYNFRIEGVYAKDRLRLDSNGYLNIPGLVSAINTGAYNFIDPTQNSAALRNQISPTITTRSYSTEAALDASISHSFFELPGGPLQVLVGGQVRRETLLNRNQNFALQTLGLNTSSARGRHTVSAGYFEINAPILKTLEVDVSGRYDHYSEGYGRFSPKVGAKFTPIPQLAVRGTYSQGFRAPTFAEANASSQFAGFSTFVPPTTFQTAHGGTTNPYAQSYALGTALVGNPNLRPEKSRSFTGGVIIEPVRWLSITVDYYNIKKTDYIVAGALTGAARTAYYSANNLAAAQAAVSAVGPGYSVNTVDATDPLFPNALPRVLIINAPFTNAGSQKTSGIDFAATVRFPITDKLKVTSRAEVTRINNFDLDPGAGAPLQRYAGTLGPYELSSGAGTPRYRGNWQTTFEYGQFSLTATAYYVSRIQEVAADEASSDPDVSILSCNGPNGGNNQYGTGDKFCYIKSFTYFDLNGSIAVNDKFTLFGTVGNVLDTKAPIAPASYSGTNYLPTWHYAGVIGRTARVGANFKF